MAGGLAPARSGPVLVSLAIGGSACAVTSPAAPAPSPATVPASPAPPTAAPHPASEANPCVAGSLELAVAMWAIECARADGEADLDRAGFDPASVQLAASLEQTTITRGAALRVRATVSPRAGSEGVVVPLFVSDSAANFGAAAIDGRGQRHPISAELVEPILHESAARHNAAIRLDPGGAAHVDLVVYTIETREDLSHCEPNMKCPPRTVEVGPLPPGSYSLALRLPIAGPAPALVETRFVVQ